VRPSAAAGRDKSELPSLRLEPGEQSEQLVERLERLVETLVVLLVRLEERVRSLGVDRLHLRHDSLAADRHAELVARDLAAEHGAHRVLHRRQDDRPRVDQRAVEIEEDDAKAHAAIVPSALLASGRR